MAYQRYNNAVLNLTKTSTPDPYVTYANDSFFLTFTAGNRVEIWKAKSLSDFTENAQKHVVWCPPQDTKYSNDLWAPELHCILGRWYIYFAGCHPQHGNKSHRMYILGGPPGNQDPTSGKWESSGPIKGMDQTQWAIDGTVIELDEVLYFVYSGWPFDNRSESDLTQRLFILRLEDPVTAKGRAVEICKPEEEWEWTENHGINEGPQYLASPDSSWRGIVYSCAGSWTKDYKMNTLKFLGGDPLNPKAWEKGRKPLLQNGPHENGPWGPGHGSFMQVGEDTVAIYHATDGPDDGWNNRRACLQRVMFTPAGPYMGGSVGQLGDMKAFVGIGVIEDRHDHRKHGIRGLMQKLRHES